MSGRRYPEPWNAAGRAGSWTPAPTLASNGTAMKIQRYSVLIVLLVVVLTSLNPAWGVSKEMIQLQTQVQALQDQMTHMQQSFDERMGVMKNLMDQNTDSMNKVTAAITALQGNLEKLQTDGGG